MVQQCLRSIATLKSYVEPEQIKIFYTPPYDEEDEKALRETGAEIVKKENETKAFNVSRSLPERHYGEKMNLCTVDAENVVFLDCDTVVGNDIWEVIEGDFEFKARPGNIEDKKEWLSTFNQAGETEMDWMPNAGFLIFKDSLHKKIRDKWVEYYKSDIKLDGKTNRHEQHALALAVSDRKTEKMDKQDHVLEWNNEKVADATVYHIEQAAGSSIVNVIKNYLRLS